jgi:acetyl-CoA C-acetyltransferase
MFSDCGGEESPLLKQNHPDLVQQGVAAEILAEEFKITRSAADEFALRSQENAKRALDEGRFKRSMVSVPYRDEQGVQQHFERDDNPRPETTLAALAGLKTVFKPDGIVTAGNASAIVDGAATILLASDAGLRQHGLTPRARIVSHRAIGSPPRIMLSGPMEASRQALTRAGLSIQEIDLWEINEAFAPVPLMTIQELGIDPAKVNISGGAIALGHPLGATGAILIGTALDELERTKRRYALVTMCIGLGMGVATVLERL